MEIFVCRLLIAYGQSLIMILFAALPTDNFFLTLAVCSLVILVEDPSNGIVAILISELELTFIGVRGHYCS